MKGVKGFQPGHETSEATRKKIGDALRKPVYYECDFCKKTCTTKPSHYARKKNHFCSMKCYKLFAKNEPFHRQNAYKGKRKIGETKQVYHRNYVALHPEVIAHLKARRYARERNAEGSHTLAEWQALKLAHKNLCVHCKQAKPLTKDHIVPLSEGGSDYISNIQPLCRNCNSKKWKKLYIIEAEALDLTP